MSTLTTKRLNKIWHAYQTYNNESDGPLSQVSLAEITTIGKRSTDQLISGQESRMLKNLAAFLCTLKKDKVETEQKRQDLIRCLDTIKTPISPDYFWVKDKTDHEIAIDPRPQICRRYKLEPKQLIFSCQHGFGIVVGVGHNSTIKNNDLWFLFERSRRIVCRSCYGDGCRSKKIPFITI